MGYTYTISNTISCMRFEVPQFIDVEDKVFGPFTFKQFVYLAGGGGIAVVLWVFVPKLLAIPLILGAVGFALALAFYKKNNKPFIFLLESMFKYATSARLYIWKKETKKVVAKNTEDTPAEDVPLTVPHLSDSKLKDLAWSLDVQNSIYSETEDSAE